MEHFQTSPLLKPFSKVFVFNGISWHFSVVDRQKRIKKYAFSNENALVWVGPYTLGCYRTVIPMWHVMQVMQCHLIFLTRKLHLLFTVFNFKELKVL